jgi:hypothetical protein
VELRGAAAATRLGGGLGGRRPRGGGTAGLGDGVALGVQTRSVVLADE